MPRLPRKWRGTFWWVGLAALGGAFFVLAGPIWLPAVGRALVLGGSDAKNAVVTAEVLGIPDSPWIGEGVGSDRVLVAADWIGAGRARLVVMTCGLVYGISGCEKAQESLVARGRPKLPMREVPLPSSPAEVEAVAMLSEISRMGARSVIILADSLDSRRLNRLYQREGRTRGIQVTVLSISNPRFDPAQWWRSREGRKAVVFEWCQWVGIP